MYTNPNEPNIHDIDGGNLEGSFPSINVIAINSIIAKAASPIYVHENPICLWAKKAPDRKRGRY
ncbi:MAG: hypothetical protein LWX52_02055 [Deltaproteobacteria bacterium]|jgi:hypothetical protein|nr:hypothetical protein [Deltaproteobacteria bacterium]